MLIMQKLIRYAGLMTRHGDYYRMSGAVVSTMQVMIIQVPPPHWPATQ